MRWNISLLLLLTTLAAVFVAFAVQSRQPQAYPHGVIQHRDNIYPGDDFTSEEIQSEHDITRKSAPWTFGRNPALPLQKAMAIAGELQSELQEKTNDSWYLKKVGLVPVDDANRWCWVITYEHWPDGADWTTYEVFLLMDRTVVVNRDCQQMLKWNERTKRR